MPHPISVMFKPSSSNCNLACKYCFYCDEANSRKVYSYGFMSVETLANAIRKAYDFAQGKAVYFSFQGGEPLLSSKDFFRSAVKLISEYNVRSSPVTLALQTNGTLLDDEWCEILRSADFLVGISIDGYKTTDALRVYRDGSDSFTDTLKGIDLLKKYNINYNVLTVVTPLVVNNIEKIFDFYSDNGFEYLQFIPCLPPLTDAESYALNAEEYYEFLDKLFRKYYNALKAGKKISIRQLDNFVRLAAHLPAEQCGMNGHCNHQFVIEADGEVFPCDFYCLDGFSLGNINTDDYEKMSNTPVAVNFIKESLPLLPKCKACEYFALCQGGCKRERNGVAFCEAYRKFFAKALPYLRFLAKKLL